MEQHILTPLNAYLEIEIPEDALFGEEDFATAYKRFNEAQVAWEKALHSERKRLNVPEGQDITKAPGAVIPDHSFNERMEFGPQLYHATESRYRESFGDLSGDGWDSERESKPCHEGEYPNDCNGAHSIAGFEVALFAQREHWDTFPGLKVNDDGTCENAACYGGRTVLFVHGVPKDEDIKGRYRVNDHTTLVVGGIDTLMWNRRTWEGRALEPQQISEGATVRRN